MVILTYFLQLIFLIGWTYYGNKLYQRTNKNFNISRLCNSATHAILVILCYLFYIPSYMLHYISITYYVIDTLYEIINLFPQTEKNIKAYDFGTIAHHIIIVLSLKYLLDPITCSYVYYLFFLSELSNLPMYVVYYLKKTKYENDWVIRSIIILEAVGYIVLRLILGTKQVYELFFIPSIPMPMIISAISILVISAIWTRKLVTQVFLLTPKSRN